MIQTSSLTKSYSKRQKLFLTKDLNIRIYGEKRISGLSIILEEFQSSSLSMSSYLNIGYEQRNKNRNCTSHFKSRPNKKQVRNVHKMNIQPGRLEIIIPNKETIESQRKNTNCK